MFKPHAGTLAMLMAASLLAGPAGAQTSDLPAIHKSGEIEYLSGGVGSSELAAVRKAAPQWPVILEFAAKDETGVAAYVSNVKVTIRDADRHPVLTATANGPFMLMRLKPGSYTVEATQDGNTLSKPLKLKADHPAKLIFIWS